MAEREERDSDRDEFGNTFSDMFDDGDYGEFGEGEIDDSYQYAVIENANNQQQSGPAGNDTTDDNSVLVDPALLAPVGGLTQDDAATWDALVAPQSGEEQNPAPTAEGGEAPTAENSQAGAYQSAQHTGMEDPIVPSTEGNDVPQDQGAGPGDPARSPVPDVRVRPPGEVKGGEPYHTKSPDVPEPDSDEDSLFAKSPSPVPADVNESQGAVAGESDVQNNAAQTQTPAAEPPQARASREPSVITLSSKNPSSSPSNSGEGSSTQQPAPGGRSPTQQEVEAAFQELVDATRPARSDDPANLFNHSPPPPTDDPYCNVPLADWLLSPEEAAARAAGSQPPRPSDHRLQLTEPNRDPQAPPPGNWRPAPPFNQQRVSSPTDLTQAPPPNAPPGNPYVEAATSAPPGQRFAGAGPPLPRPDVPAERGGRVPNPPSHLGPHPRDPSPEERRKRVRVNEPGQVPNALAQAVGPPPGQYAWPPAGRGVHPTLDPRNFGRFQPMPVAPPARRPGQFGRAPPPRDPMRHGFAGYGPPNNAPDRRMPDAPAPPGTIDPRALQVPPGGAPPANTQTGSAPANQAGRTAAAGTQTDRVPPRAQPPKSQSNPVDLTTQSDTGSPTGQAGGAPQNPPGGGSRVPRAGAGPQPSETANTGDRALQRAGRNAGAARQPLATWNRIFDYNADSELTPGKIFTRHELDIYLNHPGHPRRERFRLIIQNAPFPVASMYPDKYSARCRFHECPEAANVIRPGHFRVAFDERPEGAHVYPNRYTFAGFVHLWCLERFCDFPRLCATVYMHPEANPHIPPLILPDLAYMNSASNLQFCAPVPARTCAILAQKFISAARQLYLTVRGQFPANITLNDFRQIRRVVCRQLLSEGWEYPDHEAGDNDWHYEGTLCHRLARQFWNDVDAFYANRLMPEYGDLRKVRSESRRELFGAHDPRPANR